MAYRSALSTLTGEPGDVVLMHSDCFHATAPNLLAEPRMTA
jgi:ectoine hydroxylase-related dioxygenase (phytanoyl-CoA dioxygenase family)